MNKKVKIFEVKVINKNWSKLDKKHPVYINRTRQGKKTPFYELRIRILNANHDDWKKPFHVYDHETYRWYGRIEEAISKGEYKKQNNGDLILNDLFEGVWHEILYSDNHPEPSSEYFYADTFGYPIWIDPPCHVGFLLINHDNNAQVEIDGVKRQIKEKRNNRFKNQ